MADVSKVNVNSTNYDIKDSNAMHKGVDRVTAGQLSGSTLGTRATAEGYDITASGLNSHGEGSGTTAEGENSHAEGNWTFATGFASHTEGEATHATQSYSHAEGYYSTASGNSSHAEGYYNTASGNFSHAEGFYSTASGNSSHAEGYQTKASSAYQHVEGKYNVADSNNTYAHIIGGGTSNNARKNIFTVDWDGVVRDGTENRLMPYKAVSEAEYAALSQAEKTNGTIYFRYEANGIMREIQDNGSATSLISGALPTGQTIESYLNSNLFRKIHIIDVYNTANGYGTLSIQTNRIIGAVCANWGGVFAFVSHTNDPSNPSAIYFYAINGSGVISKATDTRMYATVYYV